MRSFKNSTIVAFLLGILSIAGMATTVLAATDTQADESIAMSPAAKRYSVDPGEKINDSIQVKNDGLTPYTFVVYGRPYSVANLTYEPQFSKLSPNTDAYQWLSFEKTRYTIKAGETVTVNYQLDVPENVASGGHYGVLFAETEPAKTSETSVVRKKRVGAVLSVTVKGDNQLQGREISSELPFWQVGHPLQATSKVNNSGNVDFNTNTKLIVKDVFGNVKYKQERDLAIFPNTTREISYEWTNGSLFGLYTATIQQAFLDKKTEKTGYVLLLPVWFTIAVVALVVALIARITLYRMNRHVAPKKRRTSKKI